MRVERIQDNQQRENRHRETGVAESHSMQIFTARDQCVRSTGCLAHQQLAKTAVNQDQQKRPEGNRLGEDPERLRPELSGNGHAEQERNRTDKSDGDPLRTQNALQHREPSRSDTGNLKAFKALPMSSKETPCQWS